MKNYTKELKDILKEDPGAPILSPDEVRKRANTMVVLTNQAPPKLLALAGSSRKAILLNYDPLMITFPDQRGVFQVGPDDIVFENHHSGRDVTEAGSEETSYEKFFAGAMKKFGVDSPIDLSPEDTKKFFNYVDKNWDAEEESDGSKNEILPAIGAAIGGIARGALALGGAAARGAAAASGASLAPGLGGDDETEDVSTGKVGKKDKGSYQHAYKLALKKYQIHSADELDTPAERKGFTAYVDRLWKGGEVHEDSVDEASREEKARRKKAVDSEIQKRGREKAAADKKKDFAAKQKEREAKKAASERETRKKQIAQKSADVKRTQAKPQSTPDQKPADKPDDADTGMSGTTDDAPKKKEPVKKKKKSSFGLGAAIKDLGRYTISKAQAASGGK